MTSTFAELGVSDRLTTILTNRGITAPFPIQAATIADAMGGRDVCGRAPTGAGKTLAFGLPLVAGVGQGKAHRPRALVLVPTRELAAQVADELRPLTDEVGRTVATFYGGTSLSADHRRLRGGVDVAIACPGRLADLVRRGHADLSDVDFVVVDEADRMADMGFLPEVQRLLDQTSPQRQTLLFSATLDGDVDVVIRRYQHNPARHELAATVESSGDVRHFFWHTQPTDRVAHIREVLQKVDSAIVFTRTKHAADRVAKQLNRQGVRSAAIHGNRSQNQRERALADLSHGRVSALVATDVAARGIHVDNVSVVVHYDPPETGKDYTHRSGRTGRAGADGLVVTFVAPDKVGDVKSLQRTLAIHPKIDPVAVDELAGSGGARPGDAPAQAPGQGGSGRNGPSGGAPKGRSGNGSGKNRSGNGSGNGSGKGGPPNGSGKNRSGNGSGRGRPAAAGHQRAR